jgi:riboflavin synthase
MFTGIVRETGRVVERDGAALAVEAGPVLAGLERGASVAVDGVCLTVVEASPSRVAFDIGPETLARTAFGSYRPGRRVNLERPLRAGDEIGGHFVQGHVDGVGRVVGLEREAGFATLRLEVPSTEFVVEKGSIALNGVSLTVAAVDGDEVDVMLIPETLDRTNLGDLAPGDPVHVEYDVLGKYAARALGAARAGA